MVEDFRGVVVAHQREDAAMFRGAGKVRMPEYVAGAIDTRALAVPDAEHAIELAFAVQFGLLGSPQRCRCQVLVQTGLDDDIVRSLGIYAPG